MISNHHHHHHRYEMDSKTENDTDYCGGEVDGEDVISQQDKHLNEPHNSYDNHNHHHHHHNHHHHHHHHHRHHQHSHRDLKYSNHTACNHSTQSQSSSSLLVPKKSTKDSYFIRLRLKRLPKDDYGFGFGLILQDRGTSPALQIQSLIDGDEAQKSGLIRSGDIILRVNNVDVSRCSFDEAIQTLASQPIGAYASFLVRAPFGYVTRLITTFEENGHSRTVRITERIDRQSSPSKIKSNQKLSNGPATSCPSDINNGTEIDSKSNGSQSPQSNESLRNRSQSPIKIKSNENDRLEVGHERNEIRTLTTMKNKEPTTIAIMDENLNQISINNNSNNGTAIESIKIRRR
ncbi:nitric oxide synthase-like protein 2 [Sarcoptes scabiei]|uniref:Nitric oxide synthase-like protein 2 n=1 Tax=Sarcoptes scabiei TaxID=52283 RepID=A0A132ADP0_SARSC|nr:nitric oxide synthase-like protein 2 [Sarcoptes scabiei]